MHKKERHRKVLAIILTILGLLIINPLKIHAPGIKDDID